MNKIIISACLTMFLAPFLSANNAENDFSNVSQAPSSMMVESCKSVAKVVIKHINCENIKAVVDTVSGGKDLKTLCNETAVAQGIPSFMVGMVCGAVETKVNTFCQTELPNILDLKANELCSQIKF